MKRTGFQSIGGAISDFLKQEKMEGKLAELEAVQMWESVIGRQIARATSSISIKEGTLFISVNSSIVRNELFMMRQEIIQEMNSRLGSVVVKAIVLK